MDKLILVLKGVCMGLADVVPGVSGGTMAMVLGIYEQFIAALSSVNFRWLASLATWAKGGFKADGREAALAPLLAIHWGFLVPLAVGIVGAFAVGSKVIPGLMESYPEIMRGFFVGLVLASVVVPVSLMQRRGAKQVGIGALFMVASFGLLGASAQPATTWRAVNVAEATTFQDVLRANPSVLTPQELYCGAGDTDAPSNAGLRDALSRTADVAALDVVCADVAASMNDLARLGEVRHEHHLGRKDPLNPFTDLEIPAGTQFWVPTPAYWYIFAAGLIAICAMVLPGLSGSFLLLVFGVYFFMLQVIKGTIGSLIHLEIPETQLAYMVLFCAGAGIGILGFSRVLRRLFERAHAETMAALVGVMLGSVRVLWPFKVGDVHAGLARNVMPPDATAAGEVLVAFVAGAAIVLAFAFAGWRSDQEMKAGS